MRAERCAAFVLELDDAEGERIASCILRRFRETPEEPEQPHHVADVWSWRDIAPPDRLRVVTAWLVLHGFLVYRPNLWWLCLTGKGRHARLRMAA